MILTKQVNEKSHRPLVFVAYYTQFSCTVYYLLFIHVTQNDFQKNGTSFFNMSIPIRFQ